MKIVVIVGIVALILLDVFLCYQVLRAEARGEIGRDWGASSAMDCKKSGKGQGPDGDAGR